jgi:hypothetical protein
MRRRMIEASFEALGLRGYYGPRHPRGGTKGLSPELNHSSDADDDDDDEQQEASTNGSDAVSPPPPPPRTTSPLHSRRVHRERPPRPEDLYGTTASVDYGGKEKVHTGLMRD